MLAFFISLFIAMAATCALLIFFLKRFLSGNEIFYAFLVIALRQGILISIALCLLLLLKSLQVFFWWDALIIIVGMVLIEFAFHRKSSLHEGYGTNCCPVSDGDQYCDYYRG
ncbi:hypothetical protein KBB08_01185, partial [Candidatus Gracilibacteria bacterium]|nr:hypothetical protein [Candidatus Gracilibacteria bacterium]